MKDGKKRRITEADQNENNFLVSIYGGIARGREANDGTAFIWKTNPLHSDSDKRRKVLYSRSRWL